jgi:hypothetical protein
MAITHQTGTYFWFFTDYREDALDLHEKELAIPVTVRHSLRGLFASSIKDG